MKDVLKSVVLCIYISNINNASSSSIIPWLLLFSFYFSFGLLALFSLPCKEKLHGRRKAVQRQNPENRSMREKGDKVENSHRQ